MPPLPSSPFTGCLLPGVDVGACVPGSARPWAQRRPRALPPLGTAPQWAYIKPWNSVRRRPAAPLVRSLYTVVRDGSGDTRGTGGQGDILQVGAHEGRHHGPTRLTLTSVAPTTASIATPPSWPGSPARQALGTVDVKVNAPRRWRHLRRMGRRRRRDRHKPRPKRSPKASRKTHR